MSLRVFITRLNGKMQGFHVNCRNGLYPFSQVQRFPVPDDKVPWKVKYDEYNPPDYTAANVLNKPWADADIYSPNFKPMWNMMDTSANPPIDRRSRMGIYLVKDNRPVNPEGRTGIQGRGALGKWGPNQAADPIVTRWKREKDLVLHHFDTNKPILQFCAIQRHDTGEWAIPGGMVDDGEEVSLTLRREFAEEVLNFLQKEKGKGDEIQKMVDDFFQSGTEIYKGYVDDHRNTDNSWMETVCYNFHDDTGESVGKFPLEAGSDAKKVRWVDIDGKMKLYASHIKFVEKITQLRNAHF